MSALESIPDFFEAAFLLMAHLDDRQFAGPVP